jgi:outer membrane receptor protein involved in Fe transport
MKIKIISLAILVLFLTSYSFSQDKPKRKSTEGTKGKITGIVIDNETNTPIESATMQLFSLRDSSLVTGTATNKNGEFSIDVRFGKFKLKISFIGYNNTIVNNLVLNSETPSIDVGTLKLTAGDEMTTKEIEVEAEAPVMETQLDKKVFNVEKSIVSESGSAVDVLKNVPSVTVDADNNVSLRGSSNVKILINGKSSAILGSDPGTVLDQLSSKSIESIEIMTNPSSKYDPEGTSGIINIILKKSEDEGYNGVISTNVGTGDKYNTSINLNYKKNKFNFYGSYNFRLFNMTGTGATNKQTFYNDSTYYNYQTSSTKMKMKSHLGSLGVDFTPDKKNSLSLSGSFNYRERDRDENSLSQSYNAEDILKSIYNRYSGDDETGKGLDVNFSHKLSFDKKKEELNTSLQYSHSDEDETNDIRQNNYFTGDAFLLQRDLTSDNRNTYTFQSDFYNPLGNDNRSKFEAGIKGVFRSINSDYNSNYFDFTQQSWIYNANTSNNFRYKDQIYSVYANYGNSYKNFSYQLGLRLEQTFTKFSQLTMNQDYENNYFSFFPSIYLTDAITKSDEIQLSYTRRINRPNTRNINPFINYSDPENLRQGNPYLKPEYVNALELSYLRYFTSMTVTGSIFYRRVDDMINRMVTLVDSATTLSTFDNISNSQTYGLEFVASGSLTKWWTVNSSISYSKTEITGGNASGAEDNSSDAWSGKLITNFTFPNLFDLQFAYNYRGRMIMSQGSLEPMQSLDIAVKKDFFNKKLSLTLRLADALNTQKFSMNANANDVILESVRRRDSRMLFLTLSYRFGSDNQSNKHKKTNNNNDDNNTPTEDY